MSSFPGSPKLVKGGLVLVDAETANVLRIISLQYNSNSLTRTLQVQTAGGSANDRVEPVRFKGPAVETFKLEADIDATDQLEFSNNPTAVQFEIQPQLALLNRWYSQPAQLSSVDRRASSREHSRSRRCWRRSRCSCGARAASCPSRSRTSALPKKLSTPR